VAFVLADGLIKAEWPGQSGIVQQDAPNPARRNAMTRSPTEKPDTNDAAVARARTRFSRSVPLLAGSVIAAAGLVFGSLSAANALPFQHGPGLSVDQQAAKVKAADAYDPVNGNNEMNLGVLEDQIEHYYGSASATYPVVGTVTVPSPTSNYAKQMKQIVDQAEGYLGWASHQHHGPGKPAVVFDIDDTLLNTYDYEIAEQFGYTSASNAVWINAAAFPAVFYMPQLVSFAASHGYSVFYITGRPQSQTAATIKDLTSAGYPAPQPGHLFLKPSSPAVLPALRQPVGLHDDGVQVRHPQVRLQPRLLHRGRLRRPVQRSDRRRRRPPGQDPGPDVLHPLINS
jgi:HAD superfamily, subfamily IIIB (Acid phosphatase)